jgi:hypothetical protein
MDAEVVYKIEGCKNRDERQKIGMHIKRKEKSERIVRQTRVLFVMPFYLQSVRTKTRTISYRKAFSSALGLVTGSRHAATLGNETHELQGGPDSIRQFLIINNQSVQQHTGKWESTFCCR